MWCPALEKLTSASSQCAARIIFLLVLLSGVCLPFGDALRCVKCSSLHDSGCLEGIGFKQTCNASQKYCVSYTGYLRRGTAQVLFRACAETNMSDFCGFHYENLTNNRVERLLACYKTCASDLCNTHRMRYFSHASPTLYFFSTAALLSTALVLLAFTRFLLGT
ncbi:uncharacterized protein LOC143024372 isoform X1 [Oratosquilla oratoria]|uniref:uncharacterized protein LOC143024372 isoform X1 n=1 Tax=Oratosquilla oratoria TaxID=337810 RepID=UPI003F761C9F